MRGIERYLKMLRDIERYRETLIDYTHPVCEESLFNLTQSENYCKDEEYCLNVNICGHYKVNTIGLTYC